MTSWPTRAEWARARQTASRDKLPDTPTALSNYATPDEIAALKASLRNRLEELSRKTAHPFPFQRQCIRRAVELIDQGELPLSLKHTEGAKDIIAPVYARYVRARAELQAQAQKKAPTDDDAWAQELQHRRGNRVAHWNTRRAK